MPTNNHIPGIPNVQLPAWADSGVGTLAQTYLDRKSRRPIKATGGWLGDLGDKPTVPRGDSIEQGAYTTAIPGATMSTPPELQSGASPRPWSPPSGGINWNNVAEGVNKVTPFLSNIVNTFRKVPQPIAPGQLSPITLGRVSNSNEIANIDSVTRSADVAADRGLDGPTSAAVRASNLSSKLRAYGDSYSRNATQNTEIGNQQNMFNAGIEEKNVRANDEYNDKRVSAQIAQQRMSSENIANASDKYVALQNSKAQRDLDSKKWTDASRLFNKGVVDRYESYLKDPEGQAKKLQDARDEEDTSYRKKPKARMGGMMNRLKKAY